jgi:hypothetical protein
MQTRFYFLFAILLVTAAAAFGQSMPTGMTSSSFSSGPNGSFKGSATFNLGMSPYLPPTVAGAPYSGDEVTEMVQTLADGGHITRQMQGSHVSRDAAGRTRVERPLMQRPTGMPAAANFPTDIPTLAEITDPVAGYRYVLDPANRVAHRIAIQARPAPAARAASGFGSGIAPGGAPQAQYGAGSGGTAVIRTGVMTGATAPPPQGVPGVPGSVVTSAPRAAQAGQAPQFTQESLGSQVIDGLLAEGTRTTNTIPVGMQGNDRPMVNTTETWTSVDLKITVLRITTSPTSGVQTFRIENLSRTTPDPSLFMPPAGYTVADETGTFTINFGQ